jgi:hypothetical protein
MNPEPADCWLPVRPGAQGVLCSSTDAYYMKKMAPCLVVTETRNQYTLGHVCLISFLGLVRAALLFHLYLLAF